MFVVDVRRLDTIAQPAKRQYKKGKLYEMEVGNSRNKKVYDMQGGL